jgi:predicted enzyme related to lactoylglutathione lyase
MSVTHFEIFAEDLPKLADFYRALFGWKIEKATAVDYYRINTGAAQPGPIQGGLLHRPIPGTHSWMHYVHVDSIDDVIERATRLGGKVVREKTAVPKTAWYALLEDPEGNIFAVYQPDPKAFPIPEPE